MRSPFPHRAERVVSFFEVRMKIQAMAELFDLFRNFLESLRKTSGMIPFVNRPFAMLATDPINFAPLSRADFDLVVVHGFTEGET